MMLRELANIPDNSGDRFKQLVQDVCRLAVIAKELLEEDVRKEFPDLWRERLEQYLQKADDPEEVAAKFLQILETTDLSPMRELADLMDPDQVPGEDPAI